MPNINPKSVPVQQKPLPVDLFRPKANPPSSVSKNPALTVWPKITIESNSLPSFDEYEKAGLTI